MLARKHVELPLKYGLVTYVTNLLRIDRNIGISLFPLFLSELLPTLGVNIKILLHVLDFDVILIKAKAQVALHVFY
jgi:hypothetical protein